MAKLFNTIPKNKLSHSNFNLSYENKTTCGFGELIPVCVKEMLPGDVFRYGVESVVRANPTLRPLMHKCDIRLESFFVPNRIIWDDWEDFITTGDDDIVMPKVSASLVSYSLAGNLKYTLFDYFGLPTGHNYNSLDSSTYSVSALPFRAYWKIWNDYYRAPEIQDEVDITVDTNIKFVASRNFTSNDYFTSALPNILQGGVEPALAASGFLPLTIDPNDVYSYDETKSSSSQYISGVSANFSFNPALPGTFPSKSGVVGYGGTDSNNALKNVEKFYLYSDSSATASGQDYIISREFSRLGVDASTAISLTPSEFRRVMATEQFLERNARSGNRYTDQILSRFNTFAGDSRLDIPEFLGSAKSSMSFGEIPQTSAYNGVSVQGNLSGKGVGGLSSRICKYRAKEHGYFITLLSIIPKLEYVSNAISKEFKRFSRLDYFTPEFEHIGEQPIKKSELWWINSSSLVSDTDFGGYQPIYTEYRYSRDLVTSALKTSDYNTWHLARDFGSSQPALNDSFLRVNSGLSSFRRVFADPDIGNHDTFIVDVFNQLYAYRPISKYGEPGIGYF